MGGDPAGQLLSRALSHAEAARTSSSSAAAQGRLESPPRNQRRRHRVGQGVPWRWRQRPDRLGADHVRLPATRRPPPLSRHPRHPLRQRRVDGAVTVRGGQRGTAAFGGVHHGCLQTHTLYDGTAACPSASKPPMTSPYGEPPRHRPHRPGQAKATVGVDFSPPTSLAELANMYNTIEAGSSNGQVSGEAVGYFRRPATWRMQFRSPPPCFLGARPD